MIVVKELAISPIKSTALAHRREVYVTKQGIVEDRRFYVIHNESTLVTQRQMGTLALCVPTAYQLGCHAGIAEAIRKPYFNNSKEVI